MMKLGGYILVFVMFSLPRESFNQIVGSDNQSKDLERLYGPDIDLINGEKYDYPYGSSGGNPFLEWNEFNSATIHVNDRIFHSQKIRYDIYNQIIILDFIDLFGSEKSVVLRNEFLKEFGVGDLSFRKYIHDDRKADFGQVIYEGRVSCIYFWRKEYILNLESGQKSYYFSEPRREQTLLIGQTFNSYRNNRSFKRIFKKDYQVQLNQFLKKNRINVKKAGIPEMHSLMEYINSFYNDEN